jgi:hypothetical protein
VLDEAFEGDAPRGVLRGLEPISSLEVPGNILSLMPKLPRVSGKEILRVLKRRGFAALDNLAFLAERPHERGFMLEALPALLTAVARLADLDIPEPKD